MEEKPSEESTIEFQDYLDESQLDAVMQLVTQDLSEPYSSTYPQSIVQFASHEWIFSMVDFFVSRKMTL